MQRRSALSEDKKTEETIREMAKLSVLTDKITDVHEKNMKMYPFVFFEGVTKAEISYNLSNDATFVTDGQKAGDIGVAPIKTKHMRISYYLTLDERMNGALPKRFKALEDSVRNLFWKQLTVEVYFNGKQVYKSKDDVGK